MRNNRDAIKLLKLANPVPDPERMPDGPASVSAQSLLEDIMGMEQTELKPQRARRKTTALLAAATLLLTVGAAWAYTLDGTFPDPAFSGDTWKLTVGEAANGDTGTYKVCHSFEPLVGAHMANGLGTAGCGDWPAGERDKAIINLVPAVDTEDGVVLFVDLTTEPVATVSVVPDGRRPVNVKPYLMPKSGKQFAVVELPSAVRTATVRLLDTDGTVMEQQVINDLTVSP